MSPRNFGRISASSVGIQTPAYPASQAVTGGLFRPSLQALFRQTSSSISAPQDRPPAFAILEELQPAQRAGRREPYQLPFRLTHLTPHMLCGC